MNVTYEAPKTLLPGGKTGLGFDEGVEMTVPANSEPDILSRTRKISTL